MFIRLASILFLPTVLNTSFGQTGEFSAFLANVSFLFLFGAMFSYWVNLIFSSTGKGKGPASSASGMQGPKKGESVYVKVKTSFGSSRAERTNSSVASQSSVELPLYNVKNSTAVSMPGPEWSGYMVAGDQASGTQQQNNVLAASLENRGFFESLTGPASSASGMQMPEKKLSAANIANNLILFANISLFLLLCIRWQESGHFPLSNLYESLIFLSWSCTAVQLFLIWYYLPNSLDLNLVQPDRIVVAAGSGSNRQPPNSVISELLGSVLAPCALFLNAFATFSLPKEMQQAGPLVPALQSNWLMMHVTVMIISYAALMVGSLLSIAYLILSRVRVGSEKTFNKSDSAQAASSPSTTQGAMTEGLLPTLQMQSSNAEDLVKKTSLLSGGKKSAKLPGWPGPGTESKLFASISENLDYLSYRIIGIGFPFLTIGILSGAVWANEAWGSYWSWDPKETWALLTWFVFAIYLHTRLTKGWEGERPAVLASFGFIVVWICYLGVNLLGEGLHSYGFFKG